MSNSAELTIMADYECYSFWVATSKGGVRQNVDPASLGLPADLAAEIGAWEDVYEATYARDDPASSGFPDEGAEKAFNMRGLELAHQVTAALGPDWTVRYFDTAAAKAVSVPRPAS